MSDGHGLPPPQALDIHAANVAEKWNRFENAWQNYSLAIELDKKDEARQVATLLTVIGEEAREVFPTFKWNDRDDSKKIDEVLKQFRRYCQPLKNVPFQRYLFNQRNQDIGESYDHYQTALRKLAESCEFDSITPDEILRDRLIFGITDDKTRERLLREPGLSLDKTDAICRSAETTRSQMKVMNESDKMVNALQSTSLRECWFCGRNHKFGKRENCPAWGKECKKCHKRNHFASKCKENASNVTEQRKKPVHCVREDEEIFNIQTLSHENTESQFVSLILPSGCAIKFQVDTGAQCNVLPLNVYKAATGDTYLRNVAHNDSYIIAYGGAKIPVLGEVILSVSRRQREYKLRCKLVENSNMRPLLGRRACVGMEIIKFLDNDVIQPPNPETKVYSVRSQTSPSVDDLIRQYPSVFADGPGKMSGEIHIHVDPNCRPIQHASRRVPVPLRAKLKETLDIMERGDIISPVTEPTKWVNSIVIVPKKDGSLRLCLDPKELNSCVQREHYPLPTIEDVASRLHGAKLFSIMDVKCGFHHLPLDEESSYLTTFNTPFGRYRFRRVPFGICSAPEIFQRTMHQMIEGLEGVEVVADDFVIVGYGDTVKNARKDHDDNLHAFLARCKQRNVHLNSEKILLRRAEVPFIGHVASEQGLKVDPKKVQAIKEMSEPKDVAAVQRFLGMVTYLAKFLPNLSDVAKPLRDLTLDNAVFHWDSEQSKAWTSIKEMVGQTPILRFYSIHDEVTVQCDASKTGLGACMMQNGQPVAYASRALSKTEIQYAQIEKELLAIVFACEHFDLYLYGRSGITIETDHKPLEAIVQKPLHSAPQRLQRMLMRLQRYDLKILYKKGKEMVLADTLSRAHPKQADISYADLESVDHKDFLPVSRQRWIQICNESKNDAVLSQLRNMISNGWPEQRRQVPEALRVYFDFRDELILQGDLVFKGQRLVVPLSLRKELISVAHNAHVGMEGCLRRMRESLFWPRMSAEVKEYISKCDTCMCFRNNQPKEPIIQNTATRPWSKVAADVCALHGRQLLIVVDYYSNFIEVAKLSSLSSQATIRALLEMFARFGSPDVLITDNATNFSSEEFASFASKWNFDHVTSSPGYPQSNGKAENAVQTVKRLFNKCKDAGESEFVALLDWRNTPSEGIGLSPAQLLMGHRCKTLLPTTRDLLLPRYSMDYEKEKIADRKKTQAFYYNRGSQELRSLKPQQRIRMKLPGQTRWSQGVCLGRAGSRSYNVKVNEQVYRRNRRHLLDAEVQPNPILQEKSNEIAETVLPEIVPDPACSEDSSILLGNDEDDTLPQKPENDEIPLRRSSRMRRQTEFFRCS